MIDQFAYSCSHDMRAPMKSIEGLLNLLECADDKTTADVCVDLLLSSIDRMEGLLQEVDQILNNDASEVRCEDLCLRDIVADITSGFGQVLKERRITMSVFVNQRMSFFGDASRIRFCLRQIVANAIAFCDETKPNRKIDILVHANGTTGVFLVSDNGLGMDDGVKERIFEPFYRGSDRSDGAGLGLFIVDAAISKVGGRISVDSSPNEGTCFTLWIPNGRQEIQGQ